MSKSKADTKKKKGNNVSTEDLTREELSAAIKQLEVEVREDQIDACLQLMNLLTAGGIATSLVEIQERQSNVLALALTIDEFSALKKMVVQHLITEESK